MAAESHVDVLIVGAGPAGLMCALGLARAGVRVKIVDDKPTKIGLGHADGIQARTTEIFQSYGIGERLLKEGCLIHMAAFYNPSKHGGIERTGKTPDVLAPTARYPFEISLNQGAIQSMFLDLMAVSGLVVDWSIKACAIELSQNAAELRDPTSYPVRVVLQHLDVPDGQLQTETVKAKFVVGADGAHSLVRKSMGIKMEGEQLDYIWGVIDTLAETNLPDIRCKTAIHSENGSCCIIPREGDMIRVYTQLTDSDLIDPRTGRIDKERATPRKLLEATQKSIKPYTFEPSETFWWTIYIIGQRVSSTFSVHDRVFIVGDACHTHSPKAGQGMNASMSDSHNLSWKLAYVIKGRADISLLKTYEIERRKYAQDLIDFDRKFSTLFSRKPRTEENKEGVTHEEFIEAYEMFGGFASGIGIHYGPSAITNPSRQHIAPKLIVGQRLAPQVIIGAADADPVNIQDLCPADTRFKILVFAGDLTRIKQKERLNRLAAAMSKPEGFLKRFGRPRHNKKGEWDLFDLIPICAGKKELVNHLDVPEFLRTHWSKVYLDDTDTTSKKGGQAYSTYGIDPYAGAIVVIRPDGYAGIVTSLENLSDLDAYFSAFMALDSYSMI